VSQVARSRFLFPTVLATEYSYEQNDQYMNPHLRLGRTYVRKKFEANYGAPLNKAKADSIGGIFDDQVRCQLVAGKRREVLRKRDPNAASRGHKVSIPEQIHTQHVPLNEDPRGIRQVKPEVGPRGQETLGVGARERHDVGGGRLDGPAADGRALGDDVGDEVAGAVVGALVADRLKMKKRKTRLISGFRTIRLSAIYQTRANWKFITLTR